jgi:ATP-dependent Lhr-like helicase
LGARRNCLFLATGDEALMQAAGLIDLWASGYIEPITPPPKPWHILAQQVMALALQEHGIGRQDWLRWISNVPAFSRLPMTQIDSLVQWMIHQQILWDDQGVLWLGREGEETYGRRNFLELFSVFTSPPQFTVLHGRQELGFVDEMTFLGKQDGPRVLLLGGGAWRVNHIDWQRRVAYVQATDTDGRSRWKGDRPGLGVQLCQSIKHLLARNDDSPMWSRRAQRQIAGLRDEFAWLDMDGTVILLEKNGKAEWWTFAGTGANAILAYELVQAVKSRAIYDNFTVTFESQVSLNTIELALSELGRSEISKMTTAVDEHVIEGLKFSECLPRDLALDLLRARLCDHPSVQYALKQPVRFVSL